MMYEAEGSGVHTIRVRGFDSQTVAEAYPAVTVNVMSGNHEDLYDTPRFGRVDPVLSDQRWTLSGEYENYILFESACSVEMATHNPRSQLPEMEIADLRRLPCILAASGAQQEEERRCYRDVVGFKGEFRFAETMQEAWARRTYCAFWRKDNANRYTEPFAALLQKQWA